MTMQPVRMPGPSQVVIDVVVRWSETLGDHGESDHGSGELVGGMRLLLFTRNHLHRPISLSLPVHFDGEPIAGSEPRFILWRLGPRVWKLAPSVATPMLHAYVTIVDVPEPPSWEKKEESRCSECGCIANQGGDERISHYSYCSHHVP